MPVTLTTAPHPPRAWTTRSVSTADELFARSYLTEKRKGHMLIQSSFPPDLFKSSHVSASRHGFVWAVFEAYCRHHNLTIRPEDVWFSILTQLNFYINAHAEELRSVFVAHKGKKELIVHAVGTIRSVDFGALAVQMTNLIDDNLVDKEFRDWLLPDFTTTTRDDTIAAAILMMGSLQKYFSYGAVLTCGIPSVTLLGQKEDWEKLVKRLDKLSTLGDEPARFAQLLRPILNYFVASFANPQPPEVLDFWAKCAHEKSMGSGPDYLSGWVSVFCFWDADGKLLSHETIYPASSAEFKARDTEWDLSGALSRRVDTEDVPTGVASVPLSVDDNGTSYDTTMVAGLAGIRAVSTGAILEKPWSRNGSVSDTQETGLDAIQPVSGWVMYGKKSVIARGLDIGSRVLPTLAGLAKGLFDGTAG
ncbi:hypothetical protein BJY04DRAFT_192647 [Aspergillus karnatakaensis]|uniref:DUF4419 domain-containing protein n=1 Tax=Aspergillus karnatakaensis TaxID=1810916 RepID=UPI003CCD699B